MPSCGLNPASWQMVALRSISSTRAGGHAARLDAQPAAQQGHTHGRIVRHTLGEEPVVAQHFAVVAGKEDEGILRHAALLQDCEQVAHLVIDQLDGSAVLAPADGDLFFGGFHLALLYVVGFALQSAGDGRGHLRPAVALPVLGGRVEGIVRSHKADEQVPGEVVGHLLDPLGCSMYASSKSPVSSTEFQAASAKPARFLRV